MPDRLTDSELERLADKDTGCPELIVKNGCGKLFLWEPQYKSSKKTLAIARRFLDQEAELARLRDAIKKIAEQEPMTKRTGYSCYGCERAIKIARNAGKGE